MGYASVLVFDILICFKSFLPSCYFRWWNTFNAILEIVGMAFLKCTILQGGDWDI